MRASDLKLIQRLQERNADRQHATDEGRHRRKPFLTATAREVQVAEQEIGFELPELLRLIYSQVANGGFGPAYGIVGFKWGTSLDGCTLESCYRRMRTLERQNPVWRWPERLLPLAFCGSGLWSCVDCESQKSLLLYALSFGPWLRYIMYAKKGDPIDRAGRTLYAPLISVLKRGPRILFRPYDAYLAWWNTP